MACTAARSCDCAQLAKRPDLCRVDCSSICCRRIGLSSLPSTWRRFRRFRHSSSDLFVTSTVTLKGSPQMSARSQMQLPGPSAPPSPAARSLPTTMRSSPDITKKTQPESLPRRAGHSPTSKTWRVEASPTASSCATVKPSSTLTESRKTRLSLACCMTEACTARLKRRPSAAQTPTPGRVATTETLLGRRCRRASSPNVQPLGIGPRQPPRNTTSNPSPCETKKLVLTSPSLTTNSPVS
mmetsp:Transcript_16417/g.51570  ORF Transcript_16417/g.51570 Transcript_16417/m.51570 type:complete len:240 (+) Transcript_16417:1088-1807(+)